MAKQIVSAAHYRKLVEESEAIADLIKSPGWKILEADLKDQQQKIQRLLAENKLRTIHETIETNDGTKTFITTAETQIAENAGMFKMVRWLFDDVQSILSSPSRLIKAERQGIVSIEHVKEDNPKGGE